MRRVVFFVSFLILSCVSIAQTDSTQISDSTFVRQNAGDSLTSDGLDAKLSPKDTSNVVQTQQPASDIETTINYNARDSIFFDLQDQKLKMYGQTHIDYGDITLEAERTDVDMYQKTLSSTFVRDTAGRVVGRPIFRDQEDEYQTNNILYNFETERAQIRGVVTEQDGAFMHGEDVKKNEKDEMFIRSAKYTTCNLEHPHFFIESQKLKVIPGNKVVSGPFQLKFGDVKTPLAFPFGMFPQPKKRTSGIIFPSYGEERLRGFFLRNGGYFWAINDYADLRATGDIYTKGAHAVTLNSNYKKRYAFSGSMNFSYNRNLTDDLENPISTSDFWYRWNHRQETKGTGNFSAAVSLGTSTYNSNTNLVAQNFSRSTQSQYSSNISYSKRFQGTPFNMTLNARQNQNVQTGKMSMSLPDFSFNTSRQYPFKKLLKNSSNPISALNLSHTMRATNQISNSPVSASFPFTVSNAGETSTELLDLKEDFAQMLKNGKSGAQHTIPISTSMKVLKNFTLSPNMNIKEVWFGKELQYTYVEEEEAVRVDTVQGFSRASSWSSGASLNTVIYGTKFFAGDKKIQALRHVMTPSVSFTYNPDFSSKGAYSEVQTAPDEFRTLSKYQGVAYPAPTGRENRTMSFSLQNNIEMKIKDEEDTITGTRKIKILDNLSMNSGYNFAADSFNLSPINLSTRTSFFKNALNITVGGALDPYIYQESSASESGTKIDRYAWNAGRGLGQLSRSNIALSLRLKPKSNRDDDEEESNADPQNERLPFGDDPFNPVDEFGNPLQGPDEAEAAYYGNNPDEYVDFNIPWTMNVSYSINRTKQGLAESQIRQTLTFSGSLTITPKTNIQINSGYDLQAREFTNTRINVSRDLHCWNMTFNWVPFGRFQSFSVVIAPRANILQDLKLQRKRSFVDFFSN